MQPTTYLAIFTLLAVYETIASPINKAEIKRRSIDTDAIYNPNSIQNSGRNIKKDVFISRGWGAGGMPFSVLYMSPYSSKAPAQIEEPYKALPVMSRPKEQRPKSLPQVRNSMGSGRRKQYSIIPQLFVSYGWGPLGK